MGHIVQFRVINPHHLIPILIIVFFFKSCLVCYVNLFRNFVQSTNLTFFGGICNVQIILND